MNISYKLACMFSVWVLYDMYGMVVSSCVYVISGTGEGITLGATKLHDNHYPITTNASYSSQQSNIQPQGIMQIQQPVMQAQQAGTPTAMQMQNPVMPVQQAAGMQVQQPMVMQMLQPTMTMPQSLMQSSSKQSCHQPNNQPSYTDINRPIYRFNLNNNNNNNNSRVGTPLSNLPLSQRIPLLPTPMVGSTKFYPCISATSDITTSNAFSINC